MKSPQTRFPAAFLLTTAVLLGPLAALGSGLEETPSGPMDLFIAFSRSQLESQGFVRHEQTIAGERLVWWSKGRGRTMVLIHGVADQAGTWFQVSRQLAEGRRLLLVDLPGHGESGPDRGALAMSRVLRGFEEWLRTEVVDGETEPPILVGNSMGAWIASLVAHRHPTWTGRIVLVNGGPLRADTGDLDLLPETRDEARRLMAALRDPTSPATPDLVLDDLVRRVPGGEVQRMFLAEEDLESHLLDGRLGEISTPVDILWGQSDHYLGAKYPRRLFEELPSSRLTWIPTCGHLPQAECPDRLLVQLEALLSSPPPSPKSGSPKSDSSEPQSSESQSSRPQPPARPSEGESS